MNIVILGAGMVGSAIARDLAAEARWRVTAVDRDAQALQRLREISQGAVQVLQADLRESAAFLPPVADGDLVISAVPGFMGGNVLRAVIEAGKDVVDISFSPEDPFLLDELARARGVTAVVDCGVAPGLCNIIAGYVYEQLERTERYTCYVGGLPQVRQRPYEYKVVFSPVDVLEEYTRPARLVENGQQVVRPALSEVELLDLPEVGTLEAFNTDGLRTLLRTLRIPSMREKTLRYPGHADLMRVFRDSGFFGTTALDVEGQHIRPIALTARLLFEQWRLREGERDLTVMQVTVEGWKGAQHLRYTYSLLDRYDDETQTTAMARTTGYTCAIVARQLLDGLFTQKGICPPEYVGRTTGCYENLLAEYAKRGIQVTEAVSIL
jgi:saccharopine dehydrogenase-like NADP-dependent oxidoreductase